MRSFAHKMIHFVPTKRLDFLVEYKQKKAQGGNTVDYGKNLARLRINANMSQEELASRLFVSRDLVSKWENNKRRPGYDALQKMASLFSVEPESIIPVEKKLADELFNHLLGQSVRRDERKCLYRLCFPRRKRFLQLHIPNRSRQREQFLFDSGSDRQKERGVFRAAGKGERAENRNGFGKLKFGKKLLHFV